MRHLLLLLLFVLVGCTTMPVEPETAMPKGALFLAWVVKDCGPLKSDMGFYFYRHEPKPNKLSPTITGYRIWDGEVENLFSGDAEAAEFLTQIERIAFERFDYDQEVKETDVRLTTEAESNSEIYLRPFSLPASKEEFHYGYSGQRVRCEFDENEPSFYAPYSQKIAKLKAIIDLVRKQSDRMQYRKSPSHFANPG